MVDLIQSFDCSDEDLMKRFQKLLPFLLLTTLACAREPRPVAISARSAEPASASAQARNGSQDLSGTSWKLVKLQTGDEETHVPDDASKYTITFGANGRVTTLVDCNTGSSTWTSPRGGEL